MANSIQAPGTGRRKQQPRKARVGAVTVELLPSAPYEASYTAEGCVVGYAFESQLGLHAIGSDKRTVFRTRPNILAFLPAGCSVYSRSNGGGEYLAIRFATGAGVHSPSHRRFSDVVDSPAIGFAQKLRCNLLSGDDVDPLTIEALALSLVERADSVLQGGRVEGRAEKWMTTRRLRIVDEMIDERLDQGLTVQDLADALSLSSGFFSRAFRAASGKPPHDYIIDRRVARARALLGSEYMGLSEIALASGFSSHAHMTAVFRSRLGTTPSALRWDMA